MSNRLLKKYIRETIHKTRKLNEIEYLKNKINDANPITKKIKSLNKDSTYGELKSILITISDSSKTSKGLEVGKALLGFTPLGGSLDVVDLITSLYKVKDEDRPDNFLANFDIDDEVSQIVDNDLEEDFVKELVKRIQDLPDSQKIGNFDMTEQLRGYLARRFNNRTIIGFPKKKKKK
jgi:hypothetical protein